LSKLGIAKLSELPKDGKYGEFGGQYVPEILMAALQQLEAAYRQITSDPGFQRELKTLREDYGGRPTPLYFASRLTEETGGARIFLKREDLVRCSPSAWASRDSSPRPAPVSTAWRRRWPGPCLA
jgi:tryptophan synthase beta chain